MQLLQDTFIIENLQVLSEGKGDGKMRVSGIFGRTNEKNNNGRIYPTAVLESQLQKVSPLISERRLCGELDHPQNDTVKLSNASHLITKLSMKGNELIGEAELLNTPAGLTAQALINGGVKIGISSRGMGTLSEDQNGDKIVNEDFRLVTFDLVADPSTRGAFPALAESTESQFVRDSQKKLTKESNFITMLESKMKEAYKPWIEEDAKKGYPKKGIKGGTKEAKEEAEKREKNMQESAMEAIRKDGHWHRLAEMIADGLGYSKKKVTEDFQADADAAAKEAESERRERAMLRRQARVTRQPGGAGGAAPGFLARRRQRKAIIQGKEAEAIGDVRASRIRKRGETGGNVGGSLAAQLGVGPGSAGYVTRTADRAKKLAPPAKPTPTSKPTTTDVPTDTGRTKLGIGKNDPEAIQREKNKRAEASGRAGSALKDRLAAMSPEKRAEMTAKAKSLRTKISQRSKKNQPFGAGLNSSRTYKQIGSVLAEMFHLREGNI